MHSKNHPLISGMTAFEFIDEGYRGLFYSLLICLNKCQKNSFHRTEVVPQKPFTSVEWSTEETEIELEDDYSNDRRLVTSVTRTSYIQNPKPITPPWHKPLK